MTAGSYIPFVRFRLSDGQTAQVSPGGLIGRASSAELKIANPEVSEAHALISLRGHQLHMLSLRRWIILEGERCSAIALKPGQRIFLSQNVVLEVEAVELPDHLFVLHCDDREVCTLSESVYSLLRGEGGVRVTPEHLNHADAYLWGNGEGFTLRVGDAPPVEVAAGTEWSVGEHRMRITARPLGDGALSTRSIGQNDPPVTIVARYDTVYIHTPGRAPAVLSGLLARIVSELVTIGKLVSWEAVAREIWGDESDRNVMRQNWDRNMRRLRAHLREAEIRADLVRPDGRGNVEIYLLPQDRVVDET
jgi:hypothetical protein